MVKIIVKKVRGKPAPWLNNYVKSLMNARDKMLRESRRTKTVSDISQYKLKRNKVNAAVRKAKSTYFKNLPSENVPDPNKFWKTVKSIYPTKIKDKTSKSFDIEGEKSSELVEIANGFCAFFTEIASSIKKKSIPLCSFAWKKPIRKLRKTEWNSMVSELVVMKQLKFIKRSKSTGMDDLPHGILKDAAPAISAPLAHLINLSLQTNLFPKDWKMAKVIPIHKSGLSQTLTITDLSRFYRYYLN